MILDHTIIYSFSIESSIPIPNSNIENCKKKILYGKLGEFCCIECRVRHSIIFLYFSFGFLACIAQKLRDSKSIPRNQN